MMTSIYSSRSPDIKLGDIQLTESQTIPLLYIQSREAFSLWKNTQIHEKLIYISNFLDIYKSRREEIAKAMSLEIGKPITQSLSDIDYDIGYIKWFINNATSILKDDIIFEDKNSKHTVKYDPIGVMAVISPRNYPTSQRVREVIPTLLAGNTVIYKCSSSCVRTANILNEILESVLPTHVFQYIYGSGDIGDSLTSGDCDGIIFTGSAKIGQHIAHIASQGMKKTFLELGGSAAAIITETAKIDDAMMKSFDYYRRRHGGQICDGIKRVLVHRSKYNEFLTAMHRHISAKNIGNPLDPLTNIGPLVSDKQLDILNGQIQDAVSKGANIITAGKFDNTSGAFAFPMLITNVNLDMQVMTEETFGPILPIYIFDSLDEAIEIANSSIYGLGGYIWSDNLDDINKLIVGLDTGNISVNNQTYLLPQVPFGGYKSASGNSREHGKIGLRELCKIKTISLAK